MKGLIRPSESKPKTIKLRMTVKDIPVGARADVTDLMLQPGESVSGWLPHVTELPWSSGLTYLNTAPTGETVYWDNIEGKPVVFPPESHTHTISEVAGLQEALDTKQASGDYATSQALTNGLAAKANTSHTHTIANITNLQTTLNGKAATSHTHTVANVTGLQAALDGKAASGHTHPDATATESGFMSAADKALLDGATASASGVDQLVKRNSSGVIGTATPQAPNDAANKGYVDEQTAQSVIMATNVHALGSTEDLNDVLPPVGRTQNFVQAMNANASTTRNYPVSAAGILETAANTSGNMYWQRYTVYGSTAMDMYFRAKYVNTWRPWKKVTAV